MALARLSWWCNGSGACAGPLLLFAVASKGPASCCWSTAASHGLACRAGEPLAGLPSCGGAAADAGSARLGSPAAAGAADAALSAASNLAQDCCWPAHGDPAPPPLLCSSALPALGPTLGTALSWEYGGDLTERKKWSWPGARKADVLGSVSCRKDSSVVQSSPISKLPGASKASKASISLVAACV